jgi:hypothetical protein
MAYICDRPTDEYMHRAMYIMTITDRSIRRECRATSDIGLSEMRNEVDRPSEPPFHRH